MAIVSSAIVIDFSEIDLFISQKLLEKYGAKEISTFKSGSDALTFLSKVKTRYDLVIVGNNMPIMDGFEFIESFRQMKLDQKQGKVILLSAFFTPDEEEKAKNLNINYFLKPLELEQIISNEFSKEKPDKLHRG